LVIGLAVVPPLAVDPALEACLLEVTGQVAAPQPGLSARNVLPAANQHEPAAHEQAASDGIADDAVVLLGANVGQAGVAGNAPPGYLPCQTGASLPTVTAPRSSRHARSALCADFSSMPITTLAVQIWAFCASTSRAGGDRWLDLGADG
jgi:hypothetical protein